MQVLRSDLRGDQAPVLAAVGPMQFEVAQHRLAGEFSAPARLDRLPYSLARLHRPGHRPGAHRAVRRRGAAARRRRAAGAVRRPVAAVAGAARLPRRLPRAAGRRQRVGRLGAAGVGAAHDTRAHPGHGPRRRQGQPARGAHEYRAKPAVPFGGHHRLIDVVLSNCLHSGIADVWVSVQYNPVVARRAPGQRPAVGPRPQQGRHARAAPAPGRRPRGLGERHRRRPVAQRRPDPPARRRRRWSSSAPTRSTGWTTTRSSTSTCASGATVTMVTTRVPREEAGRYGVVQVEDGRVTDYQLKPDEPASDLVCNEVFVFTPGPALDLLDGWPRTPTRRRACRTSATGCCRRWSSRASRASTASTATGATWAPSRPTTPRTWTCSATTPPSSWTTRPGRC